METGMLKEQQNMQHSGVFVIRQYIHIQNILECSEVALMPKLACSNSPAVWGKYVFFLFCSLY